MLRLKPAKEKTEADMVVLKEEKADGERRLYIMRDSVKSSIRKVSPRMRTTTVRGMGIVFAMLIVLQTANPINGLFTRHDAMVQIWECRRRRSCTGRTRWRITG